MKLQTKIVSFLAVLVVFSFTQQCHTTMENELLKHVSNGDYKEAKALLQQDVDKNKKSLETGNTPLHIAVIKGFENIVELLLIFWADPHKKNYYNEKPIDIAKQIYTAAVKEKDTETTIIYSRIIKILSLYTIPEGASRR
ncbi:ankyrin repeat domain-containing protein [bacterium]|jgi:hypothetical protein|nr:ankyrin repeat domain-containing protein [bacterium]